MISIVIPVCNEAESISGLFAKIIAVLGRTEDPFEIIIVNDGSTDTTSEVLKKLRKVKIITFRKNFGQTAALDAGIKSAKGELIITMDGDGQNDPEDIPALIAKIHEGYDVVSGWRFERQDPEAKKFISRGANFLRKFFVDDQIHDSGCTLKAYRKECFENLDLYGEMHRFIPAILRWRGFKIGEVKVNHLPRLQGKTKYDWQRIPRGFIDMISVWFWRKYAGRPLHLFGGIGLLFGSVGGIVLLLVISVWLFSSVGFIHSTLLFIGALSVLMGIQFLILGILADIAVKNYYQTGKQQPYYIKEVTNQ